MFIPIDLNLPVLVGGAISWFVSTRSKDAAVNTARMEKGTLIASGFIAGGALMGVVSAILKFANVDWFMSKWGRQLRRGRGHRALHGHCRLYDHII